MSSQASYYSTYSGDKVGFDEAECLEQERLVELTDEDKQALVGLREFMERNIDEILASFYDHFRGFETTKAILGDEVAVARLKELQKAHLIRWTSGVYDVAFFEECLKIGQTHYRIGLHPKWYIAAYHYNLGAVIPKLTREFGSDLERLERAISAFTKLTFMALSAGNFSYVQAHVEMIQEQQKTLMELSTPVIQVWDGIIALPLIGTVDSARTQQIMESLLTRIVETQSRMVILDITGVPAIDTMVANHLVRTVQAAKLLGAECIIVGIRPSIAQTIVQLGIDLKGITTYSTLQEGLAMAFDNVGLTVTTKDGHMPKSQERD